MAARRWSRCGPARWLAFSTALVSCILPVFACSGLADWLLPGFACSMACPRKGTRAVDFDARCTWPPALASTPRSKLLLIPRPLFLVVARRMAKD
ncbi:hypothetical protein J3F84DRAFT_362834 [Trichoderma pleuroticola]